MSEQKTCKAPRLSCFLSASKGVPHPLEKTIFHQLGLFASNDEKPFSIVDLAKPEGGKSPLLGKACMSITMETQEEKRMEMVIGDLFHAETLKKIYGMYLHGVIFDESHFTVRGTFSPNKLTKTILAQALAKVYANKDLFERFFKALPETVRDIFSFFVWEGGEYMAEQLEKMFSVKIIGKGWSKGPFYNQTEGVPEDAYCIFKIRREYSRDNDVYYLSLPDELREVFKRCLSPPKEFDLTPLESIEKTEFIYENQDNAIAHITLYYNYIIQESLRVSRSTGKLLKGALKEMVDYCRIKEFYEGYEGDDKELQYVATKFIIDFLKARDSCPDTSPPELLKQLLSDFFNKKSKKNKELIAYLCHLKGDYYNYKYEEREPRIRQAILELLKGLPTSLWVSFENIKKYCMYRNMDINPIVQGSYGNDLYFNQRIEGRYGSYNERIYVRNEDLRESVFFPFLKTMMFLFAAFGIVDIAYNLPINTIFKDRDKKYLSPFDGLRYVRLNPLGAYVFGKTKTCPVTVKEEYAKVILDEKVFLITMEGRDPRLTMAVEKIADKISEHCYKVTYKSFLKDCRIKKDIEQKTHLFHKYISQNPPDVWNNFLEDVKNKINPLEKMEQFAVFKLRQDEELISLIAKDEVLRGCILKAEKYHFLVPYDSVLKVKKRLEEFGYFIDTI